MSHLSALIQRVRNIENNGRDEKTLREKLLNVAEYLTYSYDYDQKEASEATELLWKYEMQALICNPTAITSFLTTLYTPKTNAETNPTMTKPTTYRCVVS